MQHVNFVEDEPANLHLSSEGPAHAGSSNRAARASLGTLPTKLGLRCYCFVFKGVCANRNIVDT